MHINMCYAKFIPIGTTYDQSRNCEWYEQGNFREIYMFDRPHIEVKE